MYINKLESTVLEKCVKILLDTVPLLQKPKSGHLRHGLFHPQTVACWQDARSTSMPHLGYALADRHQKRAYHWTTMSIDRLNTAFIVNMPKKEKRKLIQCTFLYTNYSRGYHVAVVMSQQYCIAIKKCSVTRSSAFTLNYRRKNDVKLIMIET